MHVRAIHIRRTLPALLLLTGAVAAGCGSGSTTGGSATTSAVTMNVALPAQTASLTVAPATFWARLGQWLSGGGEAWAATINDIASISVTVSASDISPPQTTVVPVSNPSSGQLITLQLIVKAGTGRNFTVSALNGAGTILFIGSQSGVNLTAGQPATVSLVLRAIPDVFQNTGAMTVAREGQTATLLPTGKVLVAGGLDENLEALDSAQLYDPATGTWSVTGAMASPRALHTATLLPTGKVLVAGGVDVDGQILGSAELYDPATGNWSPTAGMGLARQAHSASLLPTGKVLVAGGFGDGSGGSSGVLDSAELYDPVAGSWSPTGSLAFPRASHRATLLPTGKTLVAGGLDQDGSILTSAELYDPATGLWGPTGDMTSARIFQTATLLPTGRVLVAGGSDGSNALNSTELYDPATGLWGSTGSMTGARQSHTATLLPNGKILVAGGSAAETFLASAELYDVVAGNWTVTGSMETARGSATSTLLTDGQVLVAGGFSVVGQTITVFASAEVYSPALPGSPGTWSPTGSMTVARTLPAVIVLPRGLTLAAGGSTAGLASPAPTATADLFNPETGTWAPTGAMQTARIAGNATVLPSGLVLVAGGMANNTAGALASTELYNPGTGTWSPTGAMGTARLSANATVLLPNGKVLVAGGSVGTTGIQGLASSELYDPTTGTWAPTGAMATARGFQPAILLPDGKTLTAGGTNAAGTVLASAELYDPVTGAWSLTGSMATARRLHSATLLPTGKVLVAGGFDGAGNPIGTAELYDPATGLWSPTGSLSVARGGHGATRLPSGKILVTSGATNLAGDIVTTSAEIYFPQSGVWNLTGVLGAGRSTISHAVVLLPTGQVLVAGGSATGAVLASAELFSSSIP